MANPAVSKIHEPPNQPGWSTTYRLANNAFDIAAPPAPSNLHQDSMALARTQRRLQCLSLVVTTNCYIYEYLSIQAQARMLVRGPIVISTKGCQQNTQTDEIHIAGWRAGRREISEGQDYFFANITAEPTPRQITCRQITILFLCDSECTRTL